MQSSVEIKIDKILRNLIDEKNLSIRGLSRGTGVPASTLSEWLSNRSPQNFTQVAKVARFLDVSLHYLLFGEEDAKEPITRILKEEVFSWTFEITVKKIKGNGGRL